MIKVQNGQMKFSNSQQLQKLNLLPSACKRQNVDDKNWLWETTHVQEVLGLNPSTIHLMDIGIFHIDLL